MQNQQYSGIAAEERKEQSVNLLDLFKYLLGQWKWFVLSILLFGGYYYYDYHKATFIYRSNQTVMIKTPENTAATARLTRTNLSNTVNVKSEILQLRSKELMQRTVERIDAATNYVRRTGLRDEELYKSSPVEVLVEDGTNSAAYSLRIIPLDKKQVAVEKDQQDGTVETIRLNLNEKTKTPFGTITVRPTPFYNESAYEEPIKVSKGPISAVVGYFLAHLTIQQMDDDAGLLQLTMEDTNPQRAAAVLTELIAVYNEVAIQDKNQMAVNTEAFIRDRLAIIENELGAVESDIERIQVANQGMDVSTAGQMYISESRELDAERSKLETDISLANMMRDYLTASGGNYELMPNNTGLVDASVEGQIGEYNKALLRRNRLVEGSSTANPVVVDLDKTLAAMRNNIYVAVDNAMKGLQIRRNNIMKDEQVARGKAVQVPGKRRMMLSVERQQKVKEELYLYLLNKREENAINQAMTDESIRIIDVATQSNTPAYPNKLKKFAMGIAIGLVVPTAILLFLLMLDTKVHVRKDIEESLSVPFLAEIPLSKKKTTGKANILVTDSGRDPLTEAFRILRTNINFMSRDGKAAQVMMLTSFGIGAGKTFSSLNLAATLAFLGKKVAVLDLDLRKGTLSGRIGLNKETGLSHYLSKDDMGIADITHQSADLPGVDVLPIGAIAPNPVELLLSKRLDDLIAELRNRYDYIVVDGVPMGIVADATIMDRIADLTLFIIRAGKMDRRQLPDIERIYREKKISNLAIVLNGLKKGARGYGYGTYGYGGYGYGYGYGEDKKGGLFGWLKRS